MDQLVGGVYSAMGSRIPPPSQRTAFAEQAHAALAPKIVQRARTCRDIGRHPLTTCNSEDGVGRPPADTGTNPLCRLNYFARGRSVVADDSVLDENRK
jgi:hypothetical protein